MVKATGDITTVAGDGTVGYSGDGGPATGAELGAANGVAVDSVGDLFLTDSGNDVVREVVKATGDIITVAGDGIAGDSGDNGPATAAELVGSLRVGVDSAGQVFDANGNNVIREFTPAVTVNIGPSSALPTLTALTASTASAVIGQSVTFTATVSDLSAGGATPSGGTVTFFSDQNGELDSETLNDGVATFTTSSLAAGTNTVTASYGGTADFAPSATGTIVTAAGNGTAGYEGDNGPATAAELNFPLGMVFDSVGDLFIADSYNNVVREVVKATGDIITVAGNGTAGYSGDNGPATAAELNGPDGLAFDSAGDLFIADFGNNVVREVVKATGDIITVAGNGTAGFRGDNGPATAAELDNPRGVAVDSAGDLFIADYVNNVVREVVKATGDIITIAGNGIAGISGNGGPATAAELNGPDGLAFDSAGDLFISETHNNDVREVVNSTGDIITVAGNGTAGYSGDNGPATAAELNFDEGVAFDTVGDLFIADSGNNVVREVVKATGDIITVAGNGTAGYSGDNGPATAAELDFPVRVAVDSAGDLFVADLLNNVVREFTPAVTITITSQIAITSPALSLIAGSRGQMTVQLEDINGNPETSTSAQTIRLTTTSTAGAFYATQNSSTPITSVIIPIGQSSANFYYGDAKAGTPTVKAFDSALSSTSTQVEAVYPAVAQSFTITTSFANPDPAGTEGTVTVTAIDRYKNVVGSGPDQYEGTANLSSTDSKVTGLPPSYTFTAADAGSHTFTNVSLKIMGSQTITATDSGTSTITGTSAGVNVAADRATAIFITTRPPGGVIAGRTFSLTVDADDQYGNLDTTYTGQVTVALANGSSGTLTGTLTMSARAGVAVFNNLADTTSGSISINATSGTLTGDTVSNIPVNPAPADHFVVTTTLTSPDVAGTVGTVTVAEADQFGNIEDSGPNQFEGTVNLFSTDSRETGLPMSYTFTAADAGSHTFTGVILKTAGNQTITATDSVNTAITGNVSVNVIPAPASAMVITSPALNLVAGSRGQVTVQLEDAYDNLGAVSNSAQTINLTTTSTAGAFYATQSSVTPITSVVISVGQTSARFYYSDTKAGTPTVTASDSALSSSPTQVETINPAIVHDFVVTTSFANPDVAGTTGTVNVTAKDQYGNTVGSGPNDYEGTVKLVNTDGQASGVPASIVFTASDGGSYTLPGVVLKTAGPETITAADSVTTAINGSTTIHVTAAGVTHLVVTTPPPNPVVPGQPFSVGISAEDAFGNVVSSFNEGVTIALGNDPEFTTTVQPTNGVAIFTGLTASAADQGSAITASAPGLPRVMTSPLPIPAAPTVISEQPVKIQLFNKKGKKTGKPVPGFALRFSTTMNSSTAGLAANYHVYSTVIKKVKKKTFTNHIRVNFTPLYNSATNTVTLEVKSTKPFAKGGQVTISGVTSLAGVPLDSSDTVFTVNNNAKSISRG